MNHPDHIFAPVSRRTFASAMAVGAAAVALPRSAMAAPTAPRAPRVLAIADTPETQDINYFSYNVCYMHMLDYFLSPAHMLAPACGITQVNWLRAAAALESVGDYDVVVIWDAPSRITDTRNSDPWYSNVEIFNNAHATQLVKWVQSGGTLIMAGGVTCYGNGYKWLGSADARAGNKRHYIGYAHTSVADILPVIVPDAVTLAPFLTSARHRLAIRTLRHDAMIDKLHFGNWGFGAYHRVAAKPDAQTLLAGANGDPLVVRWRVKKGGVICVTASPRGNTLFGYDLNPIWPQEAVLWWRCLRWGMGRNRIDHEIEAHLIKQYQELIASPPSQPRTATLPERPLPTGVVAEPMCSPNVAQEFPYATNLCLEALPMSIHRLALKYYWNLGMTAIVGQDTPANDHFLKPYTEGLTHNNLMAFVHLNLCTAVQSKHLPIAEWAQMTLPSGKPAMYYGTPDPSPFSALTTRYSVEKVNEVMPVFAKYPRIRGSFFNDEWSWVVGYRNPFQSGQGIADYSDAANRRYKRHTGQAPPPPVYREPGYVAPEDEPWLKWCQITRQGAYKDYNQEVADHFLTHRKDFYLSNYPGGFGGNLNAMVEEVYLDCWKESPLLAMERMDVRSNFLQDSQRNKHPLWALLGVFRMPEDKSMYPETLRLTAGVCLGGGAKGIILWNAANLWAPYMQHPGHEPLEVEARQLGLYLRRFGAMFPQLVKAPSDAWILSGWFWVNSFDNYYFLAPEGPKPHDMQRPWWQFQISDIIVPSAMRAGLYSESVTEKQLLSPELFKKKAVILPGLLYCREAVVKNMEAYIRGGGKVFLDQSSRVKIAGATILPVDLSQWHLAVAAGKRPIVDPNDPVYNREQALRESYVQKAIPVLQKYVTPVASPAVSIDSTKAAHSVMTNGDAMYVFIYNSNLFVRDGRMGGRSTFHVRFHHMPPHVYDIAESRRLRSGADFDVTLPAGGWKVLALTSTVLSAVDLQRAEVHGRSLHLRVALRGDDGRRFRAAVPLEITLVSSPGSTVFYRATSEGLLDTQVELVEAIHAPHTIAIKELFSGQCVRREVTK